MDRRAWLVGMALAAAASSLARGGPAPPLRFEVTCAGDLLPAPRAGRVLVVLSRSKHPEPRLRIGEVGNTAAPVLGKDATFGKGETCTLDASSAIFPLEHLGRLPRGSYFIQAVFDYNPDLRRPDAPENLVSEVKKVDVDPASGGRVRLTLTRKLPADAPPRDAPQLRYVRLHSEKLSRFHRRPIFLRAGVILPPDFGDNPNRRYRLRVHVGGFGQRYTTVADMMAAKSPFRAAWNDPKAPRMVLLHLDGAGPLGDPYQVDSANHGPYGAALTEELIPYVEKRFRCVGKPYARVLDGASTGGWVSLALQVFYPDFFGGCWSHAPDPVDFRSFELLNVYRDENAYVNRFGNERPAARRLDGDVWYTMRHELRGEAVLGRGDNWALSGKDWASWNATFGPRGKDGLPVPLWDGRTGNIDPKVAEHYRKYDLRRHLEKNGKELGPKLSGKIRIWVGDADEYFLNNAVHRLDEALSAKQGFAYRITYGSQRGHNWRGLTPGQILAEMAAAVEPGGKNSGS